MIYTSRQDSKKENEAEREAEKCGEIDRGGRSRWRTEIADRQVGRGCYAFQIAQPRMCPRISVTFSGMHVGFISKYYRGKF